MCASLGTAKTQPRDGRNQTGERSPLHVRPCEEGWLRHQENFGTAHLSAADGVVAHKSLFGVSDHPVRSNKEASRHFLNVASTPPHEEGTTLAQKGLGGYQMCRPANSDLPNLFQASLLLIDPPAKSATYAKNIEDDRLFPRTYSNARFPRLR